jgi:pimeloyl-ACP methyl ester carboxylesterase
MNFKHINYTEMKTYIITLICLLIVGSVIGQERIASKVYFESGDETIEGILIRPNNNANTPAVVFQQGSGNNSFDGYETEAWGPHKFYIEDILLEQGYAVLYCNKRGLGGSTGNWRKNSFYGRANDAYAAVSYLKTLDFIDPERIGVSGHSQGGWIAQIAAAQHEDIAFIIALAGPTVSVKDQTGSNDSLRYMCEGYAGEKLVKRMKKDRKNKKLGYDVGKNFGFIGSARHWYLIADYDNDEILKSIKCPTLLLFAEHDINVNPEQNIDHFNEVFKNNPPDNFTIKTMVGGQHGFYKVSDACVSWEVAENQPFDPEFQNEIRNWLGKLN